MKDQYNYYDEFIKDANYIIESSRILDETLSNYDEKRLEENIIKIHQIENEADRILHTMINNLVKDFLPPLDREDIGIIIRTLDDIIDFIDELIKDFSIYNIKSIRDDVLIFTKLLINAADYILDMFEQVKDSKNKNTLKRRFVDISKIEDQGDVEFEKSMKRLYREEENMLDIMKWTNIYKKLEDALDSCEHISDCMEDVIMKYV